MLPPRYKILDVIISRKLLKTNVFAFLIGKYSVCCCHQNYLYFLTNRSFPNEYFSRKDMPVVFISNESSKLLPDKSLSPKSVGAAAARLKEGVAKVLPRKREVASLPFNNLSRERNFLVEERAMRDFLLKPTDLEDLRKAQRRSPHEGKSPMVVYWRTDIEKRSLEVWKSVEALEKEKAKRILLKKRLQTNDLKKFFVLNRTTSNLSKAFSEDTTKVIWAAVLVNSLNLFGKTVAWMFTGSHSIFAEALHSLADVTNQLILAYGIHKSKQEANIEHPYGFTSMRHVSSLISGAMIFFFGSGISVYHGINGIMNAPETLPLLWGYLIMTSSLISESATLMMALHATQKGARLHNISFRNYVFQGNDPTVTVVLLEDCAAVFSILVAISCMGMTSIYGSHIPDAMGSCIIGGILACVSGFIIHNNTGALLGRSIPQKNLEAINYELESDVMIRGIHDVKGIDIGSGLVRYKAEIDFDGWQLTNRYLNTLDMAQLLKEVKAVETEEDVSILLQTHGQYIVGTLGAEVDRIEKALKKNHPEVRHVDLEVL